MTVTHKWAKEMKSETRASIKRSGEQRTKREAPALAEELAGIHFELGTEVDPSTNTHQFVLEGSDDLGTRHVSIKGRDALKAVRAGAEVHVHDTAPADAVEKSPQRTR